MNIVVAEELSIAFGQQEILRGEGFAIRSGQKIGVIGANGTGKSTLLRILAGKQTLDSGALHFSKNTTIGYLAQDVTEMPTGRLLQSVLDAAPGFADLERRLRETETNLELATEPSQQEELAGLLAELHERLDHFTTYYSPAEAKSILAGLGFSESDFDRRLSEFSGGWKTRAALAGLLFRKPDLLLLDEPTNHLDVPTIAWFDEFLQQLPCAVMLVSHDREFVDRQVETIFSFEFEGLRIYTGNYTSYRKMREDEERQLFAAAKNIEDRKRQMKRFIERFRAKNTKAKQVKSKIKEVERLKQIDLPQERKKLHFKFPPTPRSGKDVIRTEGLSKSFPGVPLFSNLEMNVFRQDRIALIGANGAGKTTLLKMLAGEAAPDGGRITIGQNIEMGYYAQHHSEKLNVSRTVLDEVWSVVPDATMGFVRSVCGAFLFSGDEVEKNIGVLSGGEKARVSLARILVKPGNLLLMDEPTNHLDIWSSEALADALLSYDGTLLFVSHNRGFINKLAKKIWDIRDGKLYEFPGNLDDYLHHLELRKKRLEPETGPARGRADRTEKDKEAVRDSRKAQKRAQAELRQQAYQKLSPIQAKIQKLEKRIEELEARQAQLEQMLADPKIYEDSNKSVPLLSEFSELKTKLEDLLARWEHQNQKAEKISETLSVVED